MKLNRASFVAAILGISAIIGCTKNGVVNSEVKSDSDSSCSSVLNDAYNELYQSSASSSEEIFKYAIYSMSEDEAWSEFINYRNSLTSGHVGGSVGFKFLSIKPDASSAQNVTRQEFDTKLSRWKQQVSNQIDTSRKYTMNDVLRSRVRDSGSIAAWNKCMEDRADGVFAYGYRDQSGQAYLKVSYRPQVNFPVYLSFEKPNWVSIGTNSNEYIVNGSKFYLINTNSSYSGGFDIAVNGDAKTSSGQILRNYSVKASIPPIDLPKLTELPQDTSDVLPSGYPYNYLHIVKNDTLYAVNIYDGTSLRLKSGWSGDVACTSFRGKIYITQNKKLWTYDANTGTAQALGGEDWAGTKVMTTVGYNLYAAQDGKLWKIDPSNGSYSELSNGWEGTAALTPFDGRLFGIQDSKLWSIDPSSGNYFPVGELGAWFGSWGTIGLTQLGDKLYSIQDKQFWRIYPSTGKYELVKSGWEWTGSYVALTTYGSDLYAIQGGSLWRVNPASGIRTQIGVSDWYGARCFFNTNLY
ncbi:MAG: hypothetical protein HQK54_03565 [Oligoflexales bacterium]|nr:hypothetical protein [Oligoflexales bacterium]